MEHTGRLFETLLFTNFSDTCFRILPAVAQWCDTFATRLTIVHAYGDGAGGHASADLRLSSYFPEADRYPHARRRVVAGTPAEALRSLAGEGPVDLVIAPSGEPLGLPRLHLRSIRASLIEEQVAPLWTIGPGPRASLLGQRHRRVACCLHAGEEQYAHVALANQYASAVQAELHLIYLSETAGVPWPSPRPEPVPDAAAGAPDGDGTGAAPVIHSTRRRDLVETLVDAQTDIVFVDAAGWASRRWISRRTRHALDNLQRPIVCVDRDHGPLAWPLHAPVASAG